MNRRSTARRTATVALALAAAFGGLAGTASTASAAGYRASLDCGSQTLQAPLIANPAQLNAFYTRLNGGDWHVAYIFTSGIDNWKWSNGWSYAGASGGFYLFDVPAGSTLEAWSYTWTYDGSFHPQGWTSLGSCR